MIDLSADMGEGAPDEESIWPLITSANVACGGHAGDEGSMRHAAAMAARFGVRVGAHPSYPDRESFGRVSMTLPAAELKASLLDQIRALASVADIGFVKPHGALYNDAHRDDALASLVVDAIAEGGTDLAVVCPDASAMARAARARGVRVIREAFADRRYEPDGSLVSRRLEGSLLSVDEAAEQATLLAHDGVVRAKDGSRVPIAFDTLCVHADMEHALARLQAIRAALR